MRTELAHVLADISGADLQRLLGALPAWVSYPEYERVTWLNTVIQEARPRGPLCAAPVAPASDPLLTFPARRRGRTSTRQLSRRVNCVRALCAVRGADVACVPPAAFA